MGDVEHGDIVVVIFNTNLVVPFIPKGQPILHKTLSVDLEKERVVKGVCEVKDALYISVQVRVDSMSFLLLSREVCQVFCNTVCIKPIARKVVVPSLRSLVVIHQHLQVFVGTV